VEYADYDQLDHKEFLKKNKGFESSPQMVVLLSLEEKLDGCKSNKRRKLC
jgi:hypothetical protein